MITLLLGAQIFVVQAPPPPPKEEAARILREAPGISNRTNWRPIVEEPRGPRVLVVRTPTPTSQPVEHKHESEQHRANRLGVPGGLSVLEWVILNSGGHK